MQKKITTYEVWNSGPGLGQAQKCGRVKPVNVYMIYFPGMQTSL